MMRGRMKTPAAVARFLGVAPDEVRRLIAQDDLPAKRLPGKIRPRVRISLPDLHQWICTRPGKVQELRDFAVFDREFAASEAAQERKRSKRGGAA